MRAHTEAVRVEFVDTDAGGRIHHTAALRWAERAEHELLRAAGWGELTCFPRRHLAVEFLAPLRFGDEVDVEIRTARVGRTSITYEWKVLRSGELSVSGSTTCVYVGPDDQPAPVPAALRTALGDEVSGPGGSLTTEN